MKLYELEPAFNELLADIDAGRVDPEEAVTDGETGETITLAEALDRLAIEHDRKAEGIGLWIKNLSAEAEAIKAEKEALAKRQKTAERRVESLKAYLAMCLGGVKFTTPRVAISFRATHNAVEISKDAQKALEEAADERYCTAKWSLSKTLVKDALLRGESVDGAKLVERVSTIVK